MFLVTVWCICFVCSAWYTKWDHRWSQNCSKTEQLRSEQSKMFVFVVFPFRCPYSCLSIPPYLQLTLAAASSHVATIRKKNSSYINCISSQNTLPGCLWTLKRSAVASVIPDPGCMPKLRHQGRCPARPSQNEGAWADSSFQEGKSGTWD